MNPIRIFTVSDGFRTTIRRVSVPEQKQPEIAIPEMTEALGRSTPAIGLQPANPKKAGQRRPLGDHRRYK